MADPLQALIVEGLTRALAAPDGLPLVGKSGLFASSAPGRQAAEACRTRGLVRVVREMGKGRASQEIVRLSEDGIALLLQETNPRPLLEALVQAAKECASQVGDLVAAGYATRAEVEKLHEHARRVLDQLQTPKVPGAAAQANGKHLPACDAAIIDHLGRWEARGVLEDCPLPELYRALQPNAPTIGHFHDSLRRLHERRHIVLHPWTGPLYEIPEPALALLVGHEVAYYACKVVGC